jgi:uncharacterized protein (TIGR02588 family)
MNQETPQPQGGRKIAGGRKLAEWVTLGLSALLLTGIAAFLLREALRPQTPFVPVAVRPLWGLVERHEKKYFVPFEVKNQGRHTLRELNIEVTFVQDGKSESRDMLIDYLGKGSQQTLFMVFDADPKKLQIKAAPTVYRLD